MSTTVLQIRMDAGLAQTFRQEAQARGVTMAQLVELFLAGDQSRNTGGITASNTGSGGASNTNLELVGRVSDLERRVLAIEGRAKRARGTGRPPKAPKAGGVNSGRGWRKVSSTDQAELDGMPGQVPSTGADLLALLQQHGMVRETFAGLAGVTKGAVTHWVNKDELQDAIRLKIGRAMVAGDLFLAE